MEYRWNIGWFAIRNRGFGKKKARERLSDFLVLGLLMAAVAEAIARVRSRDSHDRLF
ncbi:unnamed protein product [Prunus armeniaca]